jgi:glycerol kinase
MNGHVLVADRGTTSTRSGQRGSRRDLWADAWRTRNEIVRAAPESVGYQTRDLIDAVRVDSQGLRAPNFPRSFGLDGGVTVSDGTMQFLADILDAQVDRPEIFETTGYLADWQADYPEPNQFAKTWRRQASFMPSMARSERESRYRGWRDPVARTVLRSEI